MESFVQISMRDDNGTPNVNELGVQKRQMQYYLCLKVLAITNILQYPFSIVHIHEYSSNISICMYDQLLPGLTIKQWFLIQFLVNTALLILSIVMMCLKRNAGKSESSEGSKQCISNKHKELFIICLILNLLMNILRCTISIALVVYWQGKKINIYCDTQISQIILFECLATIGAVIIIVLRAIYFCVAISEEKKREELTRIDQPREPPKMQEPNRQGEEDTRMLLAVDFVNGLGVSHNTK